MREKGNTKRSNTANANSIFEIWMYETHVNLFSIYALNEMIEWNVFFL